MKKFLQKFKMLQMRNSPLGERGSFLIMALIMIALITALGIAISQVTANQYSHNTWATFSDDADLTAEAGIEETVHQLNVDDNFTGYSSPQTFFNDTTQGLGEFTSTVSDNDDNSKTIVSTGEVYRHSGDASPYLTRKIRVTVVGTSSSGYSVFSGPGGLILGGSASIVNSSVHTDGFISLSGASSIGSQDNPLNVSVANYQCPSGGGASWPQLCGSGTQPITMAYSTHIYGSVCATGQTSTGPNNNISGGNGGQGLEPGCVAPQTSPPTYNRAAQIAAVTTTAAANNINYNCSQWQNPNGFTRTWPANLELTGNVNIASSCNLTITGNVYITGNLTVGGAAKITVADSCGTTRPVIVVDGTINVGGSGSMIANSSGTGAEFISFANSTGNPAATPTGQDLYNSSQQTTVTIAGAGQVPGMIFQAYWGELKVSGSGNAGAVAGQTINMSGAGTVIFGTELSSGSKTWAITSYQRIYGS